MKKIMITGASSYVGKAVCAYLEKWPEKYCVTALSVRNDSWRELDFSEYDVIYHVAGIAHSDVGSVTEERKAEYYHINTDLTAEVAEKAKRDGVRQFIFMSSAIVYGDSAPIGEKKVITKETSCHPANFYGDSKLQAEKRLTALRSDGFKIVILRCPMIYGKGSKGNYPILEKMALKLPFFPKVDNERSMLYIGNLAEFVRLMIDHEESGLFWPCNKENSNTSQLVSMIARCHGKRVLLLPGFTWALKMLSKFTGLVDKAFGNLCYDGLLGEYSEDYRLFSLQESIEETERE